MKSVPVLFSRIQPVSAPFLFLLSTKLKKTSAEEYCRKLGWKYKFITKDKEVFYKNNFLSAALGSIRDIHE